MVLGGLRRCEVLGLGDLRFGEQRVFIAEGKGGHQRLIPVSARFFTKVSAYLDAERPAGAATDAVFTVLKGQRRGLPLSAVGSMRSSTAPAAGPGWPMRPAISWALSHFRWGAYSRSAGPEVSSRRSGPLAGSGA